MLRDGEVIDVGGRRQRTLLALLALEAGRVVSADRLIEELWAGEPTDGAATTLKVHVSRLRAALGHDVQIRGSAAGYALLVDPAVVDVNRFETLVADARRQLDRGPQSAAHAGRAARAARAALELWHGDPFGNLADDGALRSAAARLLEHRLEALELRIDADIAAGFAPGRAGTSAGELVGELEALVREHPYRERFWRQLMLALYRSDRQADALAAYHRARAALDEHLGIEPGPALQELEAAILRHEVEAPAAAATQRRTLPHAVSSFLGRARELSELHALIGRHRFVTLIGPGGVGKTRLAVEAVHGILDETGGDAVAERFEGAAFVDLALVTEPGDVPGHVARALDVPEVPGRAALDVIREQLTGASLVLLLDNCEHVRDAAAAVADGILAGCPDVRVVATSREVLGVAGEVTYAVGPMQLTGSDELPDAVALFLARLHEARPGFAPDATSVQLAQRICQAVDGLPLAIELAASRGRMLGLPEIADRISDRLRFLVSWRRVSTARHRTLREAMAWSYDLLAAEEQAFLRQAAIFVGGFTIPAATAVCADGDEEAALRLVGRLVDASLLTVSEGSAETRYGMLETVREFAVDRSDPAERASTGDAHTRYFLELAEAQQAVIPATGNLEPIRDLFAEEANLRAVLRRIDDQDDASTALRMSAALWRYWWLNGLLADGRAFTHRALARAGGPDAARAEALRGASSLALRQGDVAASAARARESAALAETIDAVALARARVALANAVGSEGDIAQARTLYAQAADVFRREGLGWDLANVLLNLADTAFADGDLELVEQAAGESLAISRRYGDNAGIAVNLGNLSFAALERGDPQRAEVMLREALERSAGLRFREWVAIMVGGLGAVAAATGEDVRAARLLGASARLREEIGTSLDSIEGRVHAQTVDRLTARLGPDGFAAEMAAGRAWSNADAIAFALEGAAPEAMQPN